MKRIAILSTNQAFAQDLAEQITKYVAETEVLINESEKTDAIFVDEDEKLLQQTSVVNVETPIVFLSRYIEKTPLADTVLSKPLNLSELLKKMQKNTLIPKVRRKECLSFKEYNFYPVKKEIISTLTNITTKLTEKEVKVLKYLYQCPQKIITKEELLEKVWEYSAEVTTHTIETHIYRLRQKVEQKGGSQLIITENNGYRLNI